MRGVWVRGGLATKRPSAGSSHRLRCAAMKAHPSPLCHTHWLRGHLGCGGWRGNRTAVWHPPHCDTLDIAPRQVSPGLVQDPLSTKYYHCWAWFLKLKVLERWHYTWKDFMCFGNMVGCKNSLLLIFKYHKHPSFLDLTFKIAPASFNI